MLPLVSIVGNQNINKCSFLSYFFSLSSCSPVPKDRDKYYFKLRQGVQKKVVVTVQQMNNKELVIERWVLGCGRQSAW